MKRIVYLLLLVGLLSACGTGNVDASDENENFKNGDNSETLENEVIASLDEEGSLRYTYKIENQLEKEIKLEFTSSQRYDYAVKTKEGEQVYLYSSVASFLAVMGEEKIKPGELLEYNINLNNINLAAGEYVLTVWMTPKEGKKYEVNTEFSIE